MLDSSIIIVSWNAKDHLINCLNSLSKFKKNGCEIIVVDNCSTDGSAKAVETQFPQVQLIRNKENLGFAKANNIGIRASNARYVCLINSDIILLDDCIEKLIDFMDSRPSVGMVGPKILNPDRSLQPQCQHFPTIWNHLCQTFGFNKLLPKSAFFSEPFMRYWTYNETKKVEVINGCFWMIRREALDKVGLLDEQFFFYGEDIDWCKRFHNAGWDVVFCSQAEAIHFGGASSNNQPIRFYLEMQKADLQYWRKHHGRLGQSIYWVIILLRHLVRLPVYILIYIFRPSARNNSILKVKRNLACIQWLFICQKIKGQ
jgi:GT2 family glycosyltransferase